MKTITTPHGKIMEDEIEKDFQLQVHNEYGAISKEFFRVDAAREWHKKGYKAARVYSEEAIELAIEFGLQYAFDQKMTEQYQKDKLKFIQSLNQEPIEDKVNNLSDEVNNLSAECFNMLRKLNPKGGIREFVRMSVEFGFKAQQKGGYSEADLINYKRFWLAQDIEWFDNTNDGDIYKNKKGKVVTEKEIVTAYIQSLNQETIELEMEFVDDDEDDYVDGGFFGRSIQRIKTTRGSNGQLMAYEKTK